MVVPGVAAITERINTVNWNIVSIIVIMVLFIAELQTKRNQLRVALNHQPFN
jgi:hypothetical protein